MQGRKTSRRKAYGRKASSTAEFSFRTTGCGTSISRDASNCSRPSPTPSTSLPSRMCARSRPDELLRSVNGRVGRIREVHLLRHPEVRHGPGYIRLPRVRVHAPSVPPSQRSARVLVGRLQGDDAFSRYFKDQGWGVDLTFKNFASLDLTKENCVMWLSDHSYVGSDNKTKTLTCKSCAPPTNGRPSNCQRCFCAQNDGKCSLSCGCMGTFYEHRAWGPSTNIASLNLRQHRPLDLRQFPLDLQPRPCYPRGTARDANKYQLPKLCESGPLNLCSAEPHACSKCRGNSQRFIPGCLCGTTDCFAYWCCR